MALSSPTDIASHSRNDDSAFKHYLMHSSIDSVDPKNDNDGDKAKPENYALDAEALEVPLRLISKDVNLLISTYNSLRAAYSALKEKFETQQKQSQLSLAIESSSAYKEESLKAWEEALQNLQDEWIKLQNKVDQASWSLFVLSQRKELSSRVDHVNQHQAPAADFSAAHSHQDSIEFEDMRPNLEPENRRLMAELEKKEIEDMRVSAQLERSERERAFEEELRLKREHFESEMRIKHQNFTAQTERQESAPDTSELQKLILENEEKICLLEQQVRELEMQLSFGAQSSDPQRSKEEQHLLDSKLRQLELEVEDKRRNLEWEYQDKKSALESEMESKRKDLEHIFETRNNILESSFNVKATDLELEVKSMKQYLQSEFDSLKDHLHADFEAKKSSLLTAQHDISSVTQHYESQLLEKDERINKLQEHLAIVAQNADYINNIELKDSELNALSLQLEDFEQQLLQREVLLNRMEKEKIDALNSRESVLASMEAALLIRTKEEEANIIGRSTAQSAASEDLRRKKATIDADRASLEADKEALASLASLLEERKSAIEASLLAQSESIEAERSKLVAEKSLFESQKQRLPHCSEKQESLPQEKVELFKLALAQFEQEKQSLLKSKALAEGDNDESFIFQDQVMQRSPAPLKRGNKSHLLGSPLKPRNLTSPLRPFRSPGFSHRRTSVLSQSFRRMLSKLASTSEKQAEISLPLLAVSEQPSEPKSNEESCNISQHKESTSSLPNSFDTASDLSSLSYAEVPGHQETDSFTEEKEDLENESTPTGVSSGRGKFTFIRHLKSFQRWKGFASQLEKNISAICSHLKAEHEKIDVLTKALQKAEEDRIFAQNTGKQLLDQSNMQNESLKKESQFAIDQLKSQLASSEESYRRLLGEFNALKDGFLALEEKSHKMVKDKQELSNGVLLLEECSTILSSTDFNEHVEKIFDDTESLSGFIKNSLSDINPEAFTTAISDLLSDDTLSWIEVIDARISSKPHSPKQAIDLFLSVVDAKISTMIHEIFLTLKANNQNRVPLPVLLAKVLKRISNAVFLFSFGIFKAVRCQPDSEHGSHLDCKSHSRYQIPVSSIPAPTSSSSMLNERVQALEIALRTAEDEKKVLLRESAQNLARVASLSNELSMRSESKSAAYWKERCRFELDHRSDLVFQKRYLVLEVTCLRSNELLLLSLLDQLSESIPNGVLSPTPGLMSPTRASTKITVSSFPVIARSVLACIRWQLLIRRRSRLMATALAR
ncbi:hypothetical protein MDAP_000851 [Mitosporidium daphniae]